MDVITALVVLIPSTLSLFTSGIYAYIALKKAKEPPKDEIWETTTKILCNSSTPILGADDFADLYEQLKLFKDNGCSMSGMETLAYTVREKHRQERQQSAIDSDT